jgi:phosphoribosylpyrophosphate synthetase
MGVSLSWGENFPKGYGHTSIAYLKRQPGFEDAKNGDINAAHLVVSQCVKHDRIKMLRERYPHAILLPVLSRNKLPLALAQAIGLPIWTEVRLVHTVHRKFLSAIQRLLHKPVFAGSVQSGTEYILVDDVITSGGTISELRRFVLRQGGVVVAVVALAFAIGSTAVAPMKRYFVRLMVKFGMTLPSLLKMYGVVISVWCLTNSQVKYLLRFSSVGNIAKKLAKVVDTLWVSI